MCFTQCSLPRRRSGTGDKDAGGRVHPTKGKSVLSGEGTTLRRTTGDRRVALAPAVRDCQHIAVPVLRNRKESLEKGRVFYRQLLSLCSTSHRGQIDLDVALSRFTFIRLFSAVCGTSRSSLRRHRIKSSALQMASHPTWIAALK